MINNLKKNWQLLLKTDRKLWLALKRGNTEALDILFNKYYADLFFYGMKLTSKRDHVIDSIQDVFANIWETRKRISKVKYVKAYLFATLRNNLLKPDPKDLFIQTDKGFSINQNFSFDISPENIYIDKESQLEIKKLIEDLLKGLSTKQKEVIYLKFYSNYSNIEIGEILSIKQQSVANLLARTINLLRKRKKESNLPILNTLISCLL